MTEQTTVKQKIHLSGNVADIFAIPCVRRIDKTITGAFAVWYTPRADEPTANIKIAFWGDWLVEKNDGTWEVQHQ